MCVFVYEVMYVHAYMYVCALMNVHAWVYACVRAMHVVHLCR